MEAAADKCKNDANTNTNANASASAVLVPPVFGVGPADKLPLTLASHDALQASFFPVLWRYIQVSDPSYRILNDHLQSGFWFNSTSSQQSSVSASMVLNDTNNSSGGGLGRIVAEKRISNAWVAQIRGGTDTGPSVVLTRESLVPGLMFKGAANHLGQAWLSSFLIYSTGKLDVRAVTWLPLQLRQKETLHSVLADVPHVNVFGAARWDGLTAAVESRISTETDGNLAASHNKFYFTCNFGGGENNTNGGESDGPPLQLTLQKTPEYSTLALSQIFTFDRLQLNPMEDRSDWVRNTVGWTVAMEKAHLAAVASSGAEFPTQVAFGGAWQINRALALKTVVRPQQQHVTVALLFKRWRQPRITCSILGRHDWSSTGGAGKTSLVGLGVELETGSHCDDDDAQYYRQSNDHQAYSFPQGSGGGSPETKVV